MIFNGDADGQDLCTLTDVKAGSNSVSYPLKQKALMANKRSRQVWRVIWKAYGGWIQDDNNNSGQPETTVALTTTLRNLYAFAAAQMIHGMEWLDSGGTWRKLKKITLEKIQERGIAESNFMTTPGDPIYYRPVQNGVRVYPDSSANRASALKAIIKRDIVAYASTSTTATPGWDSILHEGLAIGMALDYALINTLATADSLAQEWADFLADVADHYGAKFKENFPPQISKGRPDVASEYV